MYKWIAKLKGGREIKQFVDSKETLFKEVIDNLHNLQSFCLIGDNGDLIYVDLEDGHFGMDGRRITFAGFENLQNYKLIYFRRVQKHMGSFGKEILKSTVHHFIGYEVFAGGRKRQVKLEVDEKGNFRSHVQ